LRNFLVCDFARTWFQGDLTPDQKSGSGTIRRANIPVEAISSASNSPGMSPGKVRRVKSCTSNRQISQNMPFP
jgi:hypothetical protein